MVASSSESLRDVIVCGRDDNVKRRIRSNKDEITLGKLGFAMAVDEEIM